MMADKFDVLHFAEGFRLIMKGFGMVFTELGDVTVKAALEQSMPNAEIEELVKKDMDEEAEPLAPKITKKEEPVAQSQAEIKKEETAAPEEEKEPVVQIKFEDVRAKLSEISDSGKTEEVRELLKKHGVKKLSQIKPEDYAILIAEAEAL